jgi:hypothetical protein
MIEIIGGIYLGSFLLTWLVALTYFMTKLKPQYKSKSFVILIENLKKADLIWSNKNSEFGPYDPSHLEKDKAKAFQSFFLIVVLCSLLSVIGFLLFFLVILSGKSRKERLVFASPLVQNLELDRSAVLKIVEELNSTY